MSDARQPPPETPGLDLSDAQAALADKPAQRVIVDGQPVWLLTRHGDVRQLLSDTRFSLAAAASPNEYTSLEALDPPAHTRVRSAVVSAFTARRVNAMRAGTEAIARELIEDMKRTGPPVDLVTAFCFPLPVTVISDLLGIPDDDRAQFATWSEALMSTGDPQAVRAAEKRFDDYMTQLIATKRENPSDDLLGAMIAVRDENRLSERELVNLAAGILVGGHETTANQLGNFTFRILTDPTLRFRLVQDPEAMPAAVEELLRLNPLGNGVIGTFARVAAEDIDVCGVRIRAGEAVVGATPLANRDGAVFVDPHAFTLERPTNPHLTFGYGHHHCLGAQLARMELNVGLTALLTQLPELRLADDVEALQWRTASAVRGLRALPVAWTTSG